MELKRDVFELKPLLQELYAQFKPVAERKNLAFELNASEAAFLMHGDKVKLRDLVLRNLIDNALRYTSHGSVKIALSDNAGVATISVIDTGIGISQEDMSKLFTAGGKGSHSHEINPDSTGYGLSSAKQIVDAHGGSIFVRSDGPSKGSAFIVTLPLSR